jgi:hypothetical protein
VALTREPFAALGLTSISLDSLRMPSPQGVQDAALMSEYITQPSLKKPAVAVLAHLVMAAPAGT